MAATTMKLGRDSDLSESAASYADADLFSFPVNPTVVDVTLASQRVIDRIPYSNIHAMTEQGGVEPRTIILNGFTSDTNKWTDIRSLSKMVFGSGATNGLLRFYPNGTQFFFCLGGNLKHTMQSRRTNFVDYVATLITPIPFLYADTPYTEQWVITDATATNMWSGNDNAQGALAFKNDGNAPAHIYKWSIANNPGGGGSTITKVEIGDATVSGAAVQGNKITWNGNLLVTKTLHIWLFKFVESTNVTTLRKLYYENDGTFAGTRDFDGIDAPFIAAEATDQVFSVKLTGNDSADTTVTALWRSAYWL